MTRRVNEERPGFTADRASCVSPRRDYPIGMIRVAYFAVVCAAASCSGKVVVGDVAEGSSGVPCETVCAKVLTVCTGMPVDCATECASLAALQVSGACPAEVSAYVACLDRTPEAACTPSANACSMETDAFNECNDTYCGANPGSCAQ